MESINHSSPENQARLQMLIELVIRIMPLEKWGFKQSIQFFSKYRPDILFPSGKGEFPTVIYDSEYCRVKFLLDREKYADELVVYYGRLHALDDKTLIKWKGQDCYCWHRHDFELALKFIDGASPSDVATQRWQPPLGIQKFLDTDLKMVASQPELMVRKHTAIWEHYGYGLFNLFDLRRSDLWAQYLQFVQEYYDLFGRSPDFVPPYDKIC